MRNLREIHKPRTIDEALSLLKQPGTVALASGTDLIASKRADVRQAVDLSELRLSYIREQDGTVTIGAMTCLADVTDSPVVRAVANGVLAEAAHRSAASVLRNQGTIVGTLLSEPGGILAVALSAVQARLTLAPEREIPLVDFLTRRMKYLKEALITEIIIPPFLPGSRAALKTVARTPSDRPIVSVGVMVQVENNLVKMAAIALGGVGETVQRRLQAEKTLVGQAPDAKLSERAADQAATGLNPASDFRGSGEYRRKMVEVLTARALADCFKTE